MWPNANPLEKRSIYSNRAALLPKMQMHFHICVWIYETNVCVGRSQNICDGGRYGDSLTFSSPHHLHHHSVWIFDRVWHCVCVRVFVCAHIYLIYFRFVRNAPIQMNHRHHHQPCMPIRNRLPVGFIDRIWRRRRQRFNSKLISHPLLIIFVFCGHIIIIDY